MSCRRASPRKPFARRVRISSAVSFTAVFNYFTAIFTFFNYGLATAAKKATTFLAHKRTFLIRSHCLAHHYNGPPVRD